MVSPAANNTTHIHTDHSATARVRHDETEGRAKGVALKALGTFAFLAGAAAAVTALIIEAPVILLAGAALGTVGLIMMIAGAAMDPSRTNTVIVNRRPDPIIIGGQPTPIVVAGPARRTVFTQPANTVIVNGGGRHPVRRPVNPQPTNTVVVDGGGRRPANPRQEVRRGNVAPRPERRDDRQDDPRRHAVRPKR